MVDQVQSWQPASWIWILIPPTLSTLLPGLVITILQTLGAGSEARIGMMGWVIIFFYRLFIISISSFEHSSFRFLTIKIQSNFTMDHVGMWVWWKCRERGGSLDTTIGIEFEYPERTNGWRTDADCVSGRPAASCRTLGNWIDRRIWKSSAWCFNSEKIHDVTQFVMMGKMLSQSVELDIHGTLLNYLPSHFCGSLNLLQLKNLTFSPRKSI